MKKNYNMQFLGLLKIFSPKNEFFLNMDKNHLNNSNK